LSLRRRVTGREERVRVRRREAMTRPQNSSTGTPKTSYRG